MTHDHQPSLARRSVLRTVGHSAWAVPAISVIGAAPAFAATGDVTITGVIVAAELVNNSEIAAVATLTNNGPEELLPNSLSITFQTETGSLSWTSWGRQETWVRVINEESVSSFNHSAGVGLVTYTLPRLRIWSLQGSGSIRVALQFNGVPIGSTVVERND